MVTVAVSYVDLGPANTFVAILVATMKAGLVAAFFMHLRYDHPFNAIIFVMSFLFLGLLMIFSAEIQLCAATSTATTACAASSAPARWPRAAP